MEKIDLNMKLTEWFRLPYSERNVPTHVKNALYGKYRICWSDEGALLMRDFCKVSREEIFHSKGIAARGVMLLIETLCHFGLCFGMTDEELDAYQREYEAERGVKPSPKPDTIDWEQRRWELANKLYFWSEFQGKWEDAIEQADVLIERYKQSLNKEE